MKTVYIKMLLTGVVLGAAINAWGQSDSVYNKEQHKMLDEVVVTGVTGDAKLKDSPIPVTTLSHRELQSVSSTNIIDAIAQLPGVSQITTGGGISKPVIRGLGYNRIVTVNDGIRQEGQQWGDEHGIEIDGESVGSIEILKGPASLLYGSDAMAGVVIFHSEPILPRGQMAANASSEYQTNNGLFAYSANFAGNRQGMVWNWRYTEKMAHAYKNPENGYVWNSQFRERAMNGLLGVNKHGGYSHLKLSYYQTIPSLVEGEEGDGNAKTYRHGMPYQQVRHYKAVLDNALYLGNGQLKAIVGYQQNRRQEYEDEPEEAGLDFKLHTINYDLHYQREQQDGWKLMTGVGGMYQQSVNLGEEFLILAYHLLDIGAFATSSLDIGRWAVSGGMRIDHRHLHSHALEDRFTKITRNFSGITGSIGAVYHILPDMHVRLNMARGFRAPNMSELGSNGEHEGTFRYEIGNSQLKPEYSWQADAGWDYTTDILSVQLALFANLIDNYIFAHKTGDIIDDVPAYLFTQGKARLLGGEASLDIHPMRQTHFQNTFSYVNARQLNQPRESRYLPLTPAPRWTSEIRLDLVHEGRLLSNAFVKVGMECYLRQNHFYAADQTETATPSYTLFNIGAGTDIRCHKHKVASVFLTAENLTNRAYQDHLNRLKEVGVYNMGRNVGVKVIIPLIL